MSKKDGFTLVELLAVIVVLAIVSLIAVPIVTGVLGNVDKSKFKQDAVGLLNVIKFERENQNQIGNDDLSVYEIDLEDKSIKLDNKAIESNYDGEITGSGFIAADSNGKMSIVYENDKWCAYKGFDDKSVKVVSGKCDNVKELTCRESDLTITITPNNNTWSQRKILHIDMNGKNCKNVYYKVDNGKYILYTGDVSFDKNVNSLKIKTISNVYNENEFTKSIEKIDTSAPQILLATRTNSDKIEAIVSANDSESGILGYQVSIDGGKNWSSMQNMPNSGTSIYEFTNNQTSNYSVVARAYNNAYNNTSSNLKDDSQGIAISKTIDIVNVLCPKPKYEVVDGDIITQAKIVRIDFGEVAGCTGYYSNNGGKSWIRAAKSVETVIITKDNTTVIAKNQIGDVTETASVQMVTNIDTTAPTNVAYSVTRTDTSLKVTASGKDSESDIYGYQFSIDDGSTWTNIQTSNNYTFTINKTGNYNVKLRAINNAYMNTSSGLKNVSQGITEVGGNVSCSLPTFTINPEGNAYAQAKVVTINSQSGYTTTYSTDGKNFINGNTVTFTKPGYVIAKTTDGVSTCTVTQVINNIDTTAPTNVSFSISRTDTSLKVTASGKDSESGIYGYQFSIDDGSTWTNVQKSNTYTFNTNKIDSYTIKVRAINNAYMNTSSGLKNVSQGITETSGTSTCILPSILVNPTGTMYAQAKVVTISSQSGYTVSYSTDGINFINGNTVTLTSNGNVVARLSDGTNTCTLTQAVSNIDTSAPKNVKITTTNTSNSITIVASATAGSSGIYGYQFSKDNGATWTNIQSSNVYTFKDLETDTYNVVARAISNAWYNTPSNLRNDSQGIAQSDTSTVTLDGCAAPMFVFPNNDGNKWTQNKTVMIAKSATCPSDYVIQYTTKENPAESDWIEGNSITLTENTTITARVTDGVNKRTSSQVINNIDITAPTDVTITTTNTSNSITVTVSAKDTESGIYGFEFSSDNGSTWSSVVLVTSSTTSYTFSDLSTETYKIKARAINNAYNNTSNEKNESQGITESSLKSVSITAQTCDDVNSRCGPQCSGAASSCASSCQAAGGTNCSSACQSAYTSCMTGCYTNMSRSFGISCTYSSSGSGSGSGSSSQCTDGETAPVAGTEYTDWCITSCGQGTIQCYEIATCSNGSWDYSGSTVCGSCSC